VANPFRLLTLGLGIILLGIGAWAIWNYFAKQQNLPVIVPKNEIAVNQTVPAGNDTTGNNANAETAQKVEPVQPEVESPPLTRQIVQPPNSEYFQNTKENLKGDLAKNFRGFSFYYPNDWTKSQSTTNFVDVARIGATGSPIEQMLVSYYDSKGTFSGDAEKFPKLVEQSNKDLIKVLDGKYTFLSQGETNINGGWKAYEMKFKAEGTTVNGDSITLWGRRIWLPAARQGIHSGFVITLLATSLSPEVKSADDVGVKGELASVLGSFEPTSLDTAY
jgi:hypothetical protein